MSRRMYQDETATDFAFCFCEYGPMAAASMQVGNVQCTGAGACDPTPMRFGSVTMTQNVAAGTLSNASHVIMPLLQTGQVCVSKTSLRTLNVL